METQCEWHAGPFTWWERSVYNTLHKCRIYGLVLLAVVSFNLPSGPDSEDLRQRQFVETMQDRYKTCKPQDAVLFQHMLPRIIASLRSLGHEFKSHGGREDDLSQAGNEMLHGEVWCSGSSLQVHYFQVSLFRVLYLLFADAL